ncbi:hypothetical protein GTY54_23135, partial [Streptomyces sp. SID625]|nr:hypothetical protein [Streptomyces sp. SID625]
GGDRGGDRGDKPHGGVHAGGGGLAQDTNTMGLGAALVLGGVGAGAYMLRRRKASGTTVA